MQESTLHRTPDRPGKARRTHLEVASPFSLFAKELPPITPPRPSWANPSVAWTGQPGLSPALPGFVTPGLCNETSVGSAQTPKKEVKPAGGDIFRPLLRTTSAAAVLMHAPHGDRDTKQEGRAGRGHSEKLLYRDVSQAAQTDAVLLKLTGNQEASQEMPSEKRTSRLSTPDIDSEDQSQLDWGGDCNLGYTRRAVSFAMPSGGKGTASGPQVSQEMSMVDLWLPLKTTAPTHVQQSSGGWQTRMEAAGNMQKWHRSEQTESADAKSPSSHARLEILQQLPLPLAEKMRVASNNRPDAQCTVSVDATALQAAGTPVPRRMSTSSGSRTSVVPPHTPGDHASRALPPGPGSVSSEPPKKCNCKKSRCLKLYCDCFAAGQYCKHSCSCQSCMNTADNRDLVVNMREQVRQRNPQAFQQKIEKQAIGTGLQTGGLHKRGCHCKKSHCKKKYCECFQAGVNCGVHCKCEECHNTPEDGLPPPLRASKGSAAAALSGDHSAIPGTLPAIAQLSKTSPGTPPAMSKETMAMDSRKEPQRMAKRKAAWLPDAHVARMGRQICKQTSVIVEASCNPGVLSPPDMLWPAQNLAQAQAHVLEPTPHGVHPTKSNVRTTACCERDSQLNINTSYQSIPAPEKGRLAGDGQGKHNIAAQGSPLQPMAPLHLISGTGSPPSYTSQMLLQILAHNARRGEVLQSGSADKKQAMEEATAVSPAHCCSTPHTDSRLLHNTSVSLKKPPGAGDAVYCDSAPSRLRQDDAIAQQSAIRSVERPPTILQADAAHPGAPFDKCPQFADKDVNKQGVDLCSPQKTSSSSQMKMKRVSAGRTVISPGNAVGCSKLTL